MYSAISLPLHAKNSSSHEGFPLQRAPRSPTLQFAHTPQSALLFTTETPLSNQHSSSRQTLLSLRRILPTKSSRSPTLQFTQPPYSRQKHLSHEGFSHNRKSPLHEGFSLLRVPRSPKKQFTIHPICTIGIPLHDRNFPRRILSPEKFPPLRTILSTKSSTVTQVCNSPNLRNQHSSSPQKLPSHEGFSL